MPRIKSESGGYYHSYASGDGATSFVHCDINGVATGDKVPVEIAEQLKPHDYKLTSIHGHIQAYRPVERVNDNTLRLGSCNVIYFKDHNITAYNKYIFMYYDGCDLVTLSNISMVAELSFFIDNEILLEQEERQKCPPSQ